MRRALLIAAMLFVATPLHAQQVDPKVSARIDHVAQIAGHDHVGIGGDLDGIDVTLAGMTGVDSYPRLFAELIRRSWSDINLAKLAGGNLLRALRGAEATAAAMRDQPPHTETLPHQPALTAAS